MFANWFKPNDLLMGVFERQFSEEAGTLVYRRYGKGPAYRVSVEQRETMIAKYISDHRKRHGLFVACLVLFFTAMIVGVVASGIEPSDSTLWWWITTPLILLVTWFVLMGQRAITAPERELATATPISSALTRDEANAKFLSQTGYGTFAMAPLAGFVIVVLGAKYFDVWTGWGRLVWLAPIAFGTLGVLQAIRKYRLESSRP